MLLQELHQLLFMQTHRPPLRFYVLSSSILVSDVFFSSHFLLLQKYKERDLIQPLPWPLNSSYPLIFHQYIYFFITEENRNIFMLNPLKYLKQQKPKPSLPLKIAVIGPPKSGKTTGKA